MRYAVRAYAVCKARANARNTRVCVGVKSQKKVCIALGGLARH